MTSVHCWVLALMLSARTWSMKQWVRCGDKTSWNQRLTTPRSTPTTSSPSLTALPRWWRRWASAHCTATRYVTFKCVDWLIDTYWVTVCGWSVYIVVGLCLCVCREHRYLRRLDFTMRWLRSVFPVHQQGSVAPRLRFLPSRFVCRHSWLLVKLHVHYWSVNSV